ncbi:hypothetical protein DMC30DRAFT_437766 [Rhodotorula diobovata]|uniref:Ribophorin II C-terminal domain-containing protein n=1 Tax=Rhodotorula diobovata TaxID=5288 RepID=A0A5C5FYY2_9BASI|nr:hypothetical protein DMC30DRAFT_437766 [Rhodotorula diobovata]
MAALFTSDAPNPLAPRDLTETDHLKLSFAVRRDNQPFAPQQAAIVAQPANEKDRAPGRDWQAQVKVRPASGKARWELDLSHAPAQLLSLGSFSPLSLTLVLGHPHESPLVLPLGSFSLPAALALPFPFPPDEALPPHWEAERYGPLPTLEWTFRAPEARVGKVVALVGLAVVLAPWALLVATLTPLLPSLRLTRPRTLSLALLLTSLTAFELLFALYWVRLRLLPTLPAFAALAALCVWSARGALGEVRGRRSEAERREAAGKEE